MKRNAILAIVKKYRTQLIELNVRPQRMDERRTFKNLSEEERLAHALFLIENVEEFDPAHQADKLNRHFSAIQMFLGFSGMYSLEDLMKHNRPK